MKETIEAFPITLVKTQPIEWQVITFVKGDATEPFRVGGVRVILHIVNNLGGWGRGFVSSLSKKWKTPEAHYRIWFDEKGQTRNLSFSPFELGQVQLIEVEPNLYVANLLAQDDYSTASQPAVNLSSLALCLQRLEAFIKEVRGRQKVSYHMPRIGCGLGGRKWKEIEPLLALLKDPIYVYDL